MQKLIEFNENQDTPLYRPSHLQELKHRSEYFEVPDLDTKVQRHNNPHYWLQRDIVQITHLHSSADPSSSIFQSSIVTHMLSQR